MPDTITRLRAEWPHLLDGPALRAARAAWAAADPRLAGPELGELLAAAGRSAEGSPGRNRTLAALAEAARPGRPHADLAGRTLLQLMLPAALGLLRELRTALPDPAEREAAVLTALLESIAALPRPVDPDTVAVAGYLTVSARRRVHRELRRHAPAARPHPARPGRAGNGTPDPGYTEPGYALAEAASWLHTARAAGLLGAVDADLITATRLHGRPLADVCAAHRLTPATARRRRARAEAALRAAA